MQSLKTGLRILSEFSHVTGEQTVTELATRLKMPKSQVSRMLATFREEGWVVQNPKTRAFSIGIAAYAAGARFVNSNRLTSEALPVIRTVIDRCGFTTTLTVLDQGRPLYLLGIDGPISVDFASRIGSYFPFHATGPGKLLTAFAEESVRTAMLEGPLPQLTPRTIVQPSQLRREFREIQQRGYAYSAGERALGIGGIAVPVFDGSSSTVCVAALGIAHAESLVNAEQVGSYVAVLHSAAQTLSRRLGCERYPFEATGPGDPVRPVAAVKT